YMPSNWIMVMTNMTEPELQALITAESKPSTGTAAHMEQAREVQKNHFWAVASLSGPLAAALQQGPIKQRQWELRFRHWRKPPNRPVCLVCGGIWTEMR